MRDIPRLIARLVRALAAAAFATACAGAHAQPETLGVEKLAPADAHRAYLFDVALPHIVDGKVHVVDGRTLRYLGQVPSGYAGQVLLSPDRRELYVSTTYYSRLVRGERVDVVDIYDAATLAHREEIRISGKRAQALNYRGLMRTTADGRFLLIQNATPATSISVVDLREKRQVADVPLPGCWAIFPAAGNARRFATMCRDGAFVTVDLDDAGQPVAQKRSDALFDADRDPLFVSGDEIGDVVWFVSFQGRALAVDVGGAQARAAGGFDLRATPAERRAGWRPGGYQVIAVHRASGRAYVTMHARGAEGSHKRPADEIWAFDLASGRRVARGKASHAVALAASRDDTGTVYALDGAKNALVAFDGRTLKALRRLDAVGEGATQLELH